MMSLSRPNPLNHDHQLSSLSLFAPLSQPTQAKDHSPQLLSRSLYHIISISSSSPVNHIQLIAALLTACQPGQLDMLSLHDNAEEKVYYRTPDTVSRCSAFGDCKIYKLCFPDTKETQTLLQVHCGNTCVCI